jgi:hypothetical protein
MGRDADLRRVAHALRDLILELCALVDAGADDQTILPLAPRALDTEDDASPIRCGHDDRLSFELLVDWHRYRMRHGLKRTVDEFGQVLGVDRSTVYRRLREGQINWGEAKRTAEARELPPPVEPQADD